MFHDLEKIDKVTKADIRRVANQTFVASNRTTAQIETIATPVAPGTGGAQ
jgi:predicted Zn-dependent peptidase